MSAASPMVAKNCRRRDGRRQRNVKALKRSDHKVTLFSQRCDAAVTISWHARSPRRLTNYKETSGTHGARLLSRFRYPGTIIQHTPSRRRTFGTTYPPLLGIHHTLCLSFSCRGCNPKMYIYVYIYILVKNTLRLNWLVAPIIVEESRRESPKEKRSVATKPLEPLWTT